MILEFNKMKEMMSKALQSCGMTKENADNEAEILAVAEARGVYSHGMQAVWMYYFGGFDKGSLNPNPELKILEESESTLLCDADHGLGGIVFRKAVERAIEKTKETGACTLVVKNGGHYGAGAFYVEMAAKAGLISWLYANAPAAAAPFGGAERYFGTNPFSFAAPAGKYGNVVLDMATTVQAMGKINAAIADGVEVPSTFGVDRNGKPCTDPREIRDHGALTHFGGPKGYGVAFMEHAVTGLLAGSAYLRDEILKPENASSQAFYMYLFDISRFIPVEDFVARAEEMIDDIKKVKPAEGFEEVMFPGEIENRKYAKSLAEGVFVHDAAYEGFMKACADRGISVE